MTNAPQDPISDSHNSESLEETELRLNAESTAPDTQQPVFDAAPAPAPAPAPSEQRTAEYPPEASTMPLDSGQTWAAPAAAATEATLAKRNNRVGLIAALAVGALVGGVSGAGVAWAISSNQGPSNGTFTSNTRPQNLTVNDTSSVNVVTAVAAKASPSVVTISVTGQTSAGTGSGVILSSDGYILTNTHVVTLDGEIANPAVKVTTSDGHLYDATVIGTDPIADLAVIKLKSASGLVPAEFADSSKLNVGETAVAIGAPLGLSNTVTDGIVSALNRSISIASSAAPSNGAKTDPTTPNSGSPFDFWQFPKGGGSQGQSPTPPSGKATTISLPVIQTDAAINPGNSGGALLNSNAQVIGINVAIASAGQATTASQGGSIGVGFAIPSNLAQRVAKEIIKNGSATHGLLGASVGDISASDSSSVVGASLKEVSAGGAAAKAGLKAGDVVTAFDGVPVTNATDLTAQVRYLPAGATSTLTFVRGGKSVSVNVTLGTLKL